MGGEVKGSPTTVTVIRKPAVATLIFLNTGTLEGKVSSFVVNEKKKSKTARNKCHSVVIIPMIKCASLSTWGSVEEELCSGLEMGRLHWPPYIHCVSSTTREKQ